MQEQMTEIGVRDFILLYNYLRTYIKEMNIHWNVSIISACLKLNKFYNIFSLPNLINSHINYSNGNIKIHAAIFGRYSNF